MRLRIFFLSVLAVLTITESRALASNDVLLPSDSKTAPSVNLGLAPVSETPAAAASPTTAQAPASAPTEKDNADTISHDASQPELAAPSEKDLLPYTPVPEQSANTGNGLQTFVIKSPDPATAIATLYQNMKLPYSMKINLAAPADWASADAGTIGNLLGIPKNRIASSCLLSIGGMLSTDKSSYVFDSGQSPNTVVPFDGKPTGTIFAVQALCNIGPLPANKGAINQIGDKYSVPLGSANCPIPAGKTIYQVKVVYSGYGNAKCEF